MTNTKHTPGPWQVVGSNVYGNNMRAMLPINGADARLIASAPELLDALAMFVNAVDSWQDDDQPQDASDFIALIETTAEAARDAMTRATGDQS